MTHPISLQHLFAKREKARVSQAIVFENDPFLLLIEEPGNRFAHRCAASKVLVPEKRLHLAVPIDLFQHRPSLSAKTPLTPVFGSGPIGSDVKTGWLIGATGFKDLPRRFRTIED